MEKLGKLLEELAELKKQYMDKVGEVNEILQKEVIIPQNAISFSTARNNGPRKGTLKSFVIECLEEMGEADLKEISLYVHKKVKSGEYITSSGNIPNMVAQILHKLKKDDIVSTNKDSGKTLYFLMEKSQ